jgi:CheY-like chemotaxis protein
MAQPVDVRRQASRAQARARLHGGFVEHARRSVGELVELITSERDPDLLDPVVAELARLSASAEALGAHHLAEVLTAAAAGGNLAEVASRLPAVLAMSREKGHVQVFRTVVVVGEPGLAAGFERTLGPLMVYDEVAEIGPEAWARDVAALVVPCEALGELPPQAAGVEVMVYGSAAELQAAGAPGLDGVVGYFVAPLRVGDAVQRIRTRTWFDTVAAPRALVLADNSALRKHVVRLLAEEGFVVDSGADGSKLVEQLEAMRPDVVLVSSQRSEVAIDVARTASRCGTGAPPAVLVVAGRMGAEPFHEAGADDVIDPSTSMSTLVERVRAHTVRRQRVVPSVDPVTGLWSGPFALALLERQLLAARRARMPLAVGLVSLDGAAPSEGGWRAQERPDQLLARAVTAGVRSSDVVGRVAPGVVLVVMPGSDAPHAERRLAEVSASVRDSLPEAGLPGGVSMAVVDDQRGADDLLLKLDDALMRARRGEA